MKILFVSNEPLSEAVIKRLDLASLIEHNKSNHFAFFSPLDTHNHRNFLIDSDQDRSSGLIYHELMTWTSILKFVSKKGDYDAIIWLFPITRWRSLIAFHILQLFKRSSKIGLLYVKPLTFPKKEIQPKFNFNGHLKLPLFERIINFILRKGGLLKISLDFIIVSGSEAETFLSDKIRDIRKVKRILTLSFNASRYFKVTKLQVDKSLTGHRRKMGLFIDQGLPLHPDYRNKKVNLEHYYAGLRKLIGKVEQHYSASIDISLHPRVKSGLQTFEDLNIINGQVLDVIDDYDFAVTMFSSAAEWFVLSGKPVIVVSPVHYLKLFPEITGMALSLEIEPITELTPSTSFPSLALDEAVQENYLKRYSFQETRSHCVWLDTIEQLEDMH